MKKFVLFAVLFSFLSSVAAADEQSLNMENAMLSTATSWTNQSGSVASISFTQSPSQPATYLVSGTYVNNAAGYQCKGTAYPLSGIYYANTQTISFSVAWSNSAEDCQSVTGWTGYIDISQSPLKMQTSWNLAFSGIAGHQIQPGNDTFTMKTVTVHDKLIVN